MSVVVAIKDGDRVLMGADCQVSCGGDKAVLISPNLRKVWEVEGHPNTLMGGVGGLRDLNIAYAMDTLYEPIRDEANKELDFKFVVNTVVPNLLNHFTSHGRTVNEKGLASLYRSSFLIAQKDKCYMIDSDGCVMDLSLDGECLAIGSGSLVARAAYETLADLEGLTIEEKLLKALIQTCEQDMGVNYPIYIKDTSNPDAMIMFDGVDTYKLGFQEEKEEDNVEEKEEE